MSDFINFTIDHLDPLGQGVFKNDEKVYFIPKTLPGEQGIAKILKRTKGVHFCQVTELHKESPLRTTSPCPHFENCDSCHYLHTSYQEELNFKQKSLEKNLQNFKSYHLKIMQAPHRLGYRNRIKLHFGPFGMGYKKERSKKVAPISNCLLAEEMIQNQIKSFSPPSGKEGLAYFSSQEEIITSQKELSISFSQVNPAMNEQLKDYVLNKTKTLFSSPFSLLELFAGNGNLSQQLNFSRRQCIDISNYHYEGYTSLNLFDPKQVQALLSEEAETVDLLLLDPPRSGFKELNLVTSHISPDYILYVSCHAATMARDIQSLQNYELCEVALLDMFPATRHFETIALCKKVLS